MQWYVTAKWEDNKNGTHGEVTSRLDSKWDNEIVMEAVWKKIEEFYYDGVDDPRTCVRVVSWKIYRTESKLVSTRTL